MRTAVLLAIAMFALGFAFGKGWLPPDSNRTQGGVVEVTNLHGEGSYEPSYSHYQLRDGEFGSAEGSIVLRNNADVPMTIMATITLYDGGDQTVATLFARADRVKPSTEQKVSIQGRYQPHTEVAIDLAALP